MLALLLDPGSRKFPVQMFNLTDVFTDLGFLNVLLTFSVGGFGLNEPVCTRPCPKSLTEGQTTSFLVCFTLKSRPASLPVIKMRGGCSGDNSYQFGVTLAIDLIKKLRHCLMSFPLDWAPSNQAPCQVPPPPVSLAPALLRASETLRP